MRYSYRQSNTAFTLRDSRSMSLRKFLAFRIAYFLLLVVCVSLAQAPPGDLNATVKAIDDHYNRLKSFKATFVEIYQGGGITRNESGVLWLKKPGRMRWEYRHPREKLFLAYSQSAFFYV